MLMRPRTGLQDEKAYGLLDVELQVSSVLVKLVWGYYGVLVAFDLQSIVLRSHAGTRVNRLVRARVVCASCRFSAISIRNPV